MPDVLLADAMEMELGGNLFNYDRNFKIYLSIVL